MPSDGDGKDDEVERVCCNGTTGVSVRYVRVVRAKSVDLGMTSDPGSSYDYSLPTNVAHQVHAASQESGVPCEQSGDFASIRRSLDESYHGCYTLERQKLQDVLIHDVVGSGTRKDSPWAIFTAGAMGAGKGHVMEWLCQRGFFPLPDIVTVDTDRFRSELPEWPGYIQRDPGTAGYLTHRESGYLVEIAQAAAMDMHKNVWTDGSLRDSEWYTKVFEQMRETWPAYRIAIFHVSAPWEVVVARARARALITGRVVPEADLRASFEQVPRSVERLAALADFTANIENTDMPRLVSMTVQGDLTLNTSGDWREVRDRFAALPVLKATSKAPGKARRFVESLILANPVIVFSKTYCHYCVKVKKIITEVLGSTDFHVVELDTMTLENNEEWEDTEGDVGVVVQLELLRITGYRLVPQVFLGGRFVGGCTEVEALQERGALQALISAALSAPGPPEEL